MPPGKGIFSVFLSKVLQAYPTGEAKPLSMQQVPGSLWVVPGSAEEAEPRLPPSVTLPQPHCAPKTLITASSYPNCTEGKSRRP